MCAQHVFFHESRMDRVEVPAVIAAVAVQHLCQWCGLAFVSAKARDMHARIAHGHRNPVKAKIGDGSRCGACGTDFRQRFRLVAHLSDTRPSRCACRDVYLMQPDVDPELAAKLNAVDAALQTASRREGRSHAIAAQPAVSFSGKWIGRVTR